MKFSEQPTVLVLRLWVFLCLVFGLVSCQSGRSGEASVVHGESKPRRVMKGYVGLTTKEASAKAEAVGKPWRVVSVDGNSQPVTKDWRPERLNFAVEKGVVVRVTKG